MPELEPTTEKSATPAVPAASTPAPAYVPPPLQPSRDLGFALVVIGAAGTLFSSWTLFSQNSTDDMVAGYWCTVLCVVAALATAGQRTTLAGFPLAAVSALAGILLMLVGFLNDYTATVTWTMTLGGIVIGLGGVAQSAPPRT